MSLELTIKPVRVATTIAKIATGVAIGWYANNYFTEDKTILDQYQRQQYIDDQGLHMYENGYKHIPADQLRDLQLQKEELPRG